MSDQRLSIAQDLSAIEDMYARLRSEAINRAGDPEMPGGAAMVMLGPGADVEAWGYVQLSSIFGRLNIDKEEQDRIERTGIEPPLSFLASWADIVREERGGEPSGRRASIGGEALYLRASIDWMLSTNDEGEPWWLPVDDFATRLHQVRVTLENVLKDGERSERINALCKNCTLAPRLCFRRGEAKDGSKDHWYCPNKSCGHVFDEEGVRRCWRQMFVQRGDAPEWVPLRKAAAALARPVSTLRTWTLPPDRGDGEPKRDENGEPMKARVESETRPDGLTWVRWSDARAADDTLERRGKQRNVA